MDVGFLDVRRSMARGQTEITVLLLLLGLLLLSATRTSLAQQQQSNASSASTSHGGRTAGGFTPTTVVVLVVLISAFVLLTLFSIYINRCAAHHPRRAFAGAAPRPRIAAASLDAAATQYDSAGHCRPRGLDRELVEAFPTAVYGDVKSRMATKSGPLECAVCLAEFDDADELRILPACCHVFHPGCIDPWLAAAVTCPLCRADLAVTDPPAADLTTDQEIPMVQEEEEEECAAPPSQVSSSFMPESETCYSTTWRHEFTGAGAECCYRYRRTLSAMDAVPDRHTLRLPEHVMKELAAVRRHRRAASLAEYPDAAAERTTPGWLASFLRSMSRHRQSRADSGSDAAAGEEQQHGGSKQIYPVAGEKPGGSGSGGDEKKCSDDVDELNRV